MTDARHEKRDRFLAALEQGPVVMGILNVTPDSFSDGGAYGGGFDRVGAAVSHGLAMAAAGAAIIDVGGESTRPGATAVAEDEEWTRIAPVLAALCPALPVAVSIDTYKASVARRAVASGVAVINDIWGLQGDSAMASLAAESGSAVVVMHNRDAADPQIDILDDIRRFFERSLAIARNAGIPDAHVILDPGIGFGKTLAQNYACLAGLDRLTVFGRPLLLGLSRKRMIGEVLNADIPARLTGTLAANVLGLVRGARILRVHDVPEHVEALKIFNATTNATGVSR
ncbi:MAG: dihydropteroate synthase [Paracoccaceae bacterium]